MDEQTRVNQIKVRERRRWIQPPMPEEQSSKTSAQLTELPAKIKGWQAFWQPENLSRNLALVGCLALVVLAVSHTEEAENVSVFSALQSELSATWEEDIGKLSFVSELLPPEIREVWNPAPVVSVMAPVTGHVVHAWSEKEPYIELASSGPEVCTAGDGEVMSIAHGLEEERIVRIRHSDGSEALYGNLQTALVEVGSLVACGERIGVLVPGKPLAFELRVNGRSIDPVPCMTALLP